MISFTQLTLLHLSLLEGIGPATIAALITHKPADMPWQELYTLSASELAVLVKLSLEKAQQIVAGLADQKILETELELLERHAISWCSLLDDDYPALLKHIYAPPVIIYWRGTNLKWHTNTMAVVGSRDANTYGEQVIASLIPDLVSQGFSIISGGALGADSFAHKRTLEIGGSTVAVLGSGLLKLYPITNKQLFEAIVDNGGALLSCFPLSTPASPGNFPARNRIISGMSNGCIVVQAAAKSGALITAQYALEQGREVFAVPGSIYDPLSAGCHALLQQGATLVAQSSDIFTALGISASTENLRASDKLIEQQKTISFEIKKEPLALLGNAELTPEQKIRDFCSTPRALDEVAEWVQKDYVSVQNLLCTLQLQGRIEQDFVGRWYCKR